MKTLERARGYLAKLPVAVSGQGGHKATFRAASVLVHGFALGKDEALSVLREWNRGCQPICRKPTRTEIHARWLAGVRNEPMEIAS